MLNLKLHVTICHKTFLFVLFLKEYKNDEIKKNISKLLKCFSSFMM